MEGGAKAKHFFQFEEMFYYIRILRLQIIQYKDMKSDSYNFLHTCPNIIVKN